MAQAMRHCKKLRAKDLVHFIKSDVCGAWRLLLNELCGRARCDRGAGDFGFAMTNDGFNLDVLIDALAERVAAKVVERTQPGGAPVKPRLLTVDQAAVYIGRTKEAVQHMISGGKLPTVRP